MQYNRLVHIDGLRGAAAVMVMVSHFLCAFYPAFITMDHADVHTSSGIELLIASTPLNIIYNGNFAVCLFFVISGYVLSYSFLSNGDPEIIYSSAFRRYPRLMIPVLATSLLYFAFISWSLFPTVQTASITHSAWLARMFTLAPDWAAMLWNSIVELPVRYSVETPYNPVLWTIGHEIRGSFIVYLILLVSAKRANRWIFYLVSSVVLIKSYYILFIAGIMLCDYQLTGRLPKAGVVVKLLLLAGAAWFGSYRLTTGTAAWSLLDPLCRVIKPQAIGAILLFYVFIASPPVHRVFGNRFFRFLGDVSYQLYLIHLLVICSAACYIFTWLTGTCLLSYHHAFLVTFCCSSALILLLSKVLYEAVDKPGIRFSRWFYKWLFR